MSNANVSPIRKTTNIAESIRTALAADFIRFERVARILALAVESGKNVLLWGPGGHGKSEMVTAALAAVTDWDKVFVQSFGEGMDEATLWGGLDFRALEEDKKLLYHPENSFLAAQFAVFEEMFDAPATVTMALKDTLTAKELRKGGQRFKMATKTIVAITNKDPSEIADLGPAAAALVERFPLQLMVNWPSYEATDYNQLFQKVGPKLPGADLNGAQSVLAEIIAKASGEGNIISPRTAVHALGVVKTAAALRGSGKVEKEDLIDLQYLPGMESLAEEIEKELEDAYKRAAAEGAMRDAERELERILADASGESSPIKLMQAHKRLLSFGDVVAKLTVTDNLTERRKQLREAVNAKADEFLRSAVENVRT